MRTYASGRADDRRWAWVVWLAMAVTLLVHLPTFGARHREGDEVVYVGLSRAMGWDLSHYTTRDIPKVNRFPNALYRAELFPHPPLYPLLLKLAGGAQAALGAEGSFALLLVGLAFKLLAIGAMRRLLRRLCDTPWVPPLGALALAVAPILSFTSTRLLTDSAFEALLLCSALALVEAIDDARPRAWLTAGLVLALFLNTKYQALLFLPLPLVILGHALLGHADRRAWLGAHRTQLLALALPVVLIGLSHPLRMWLVYGTPSIAHLMVADRPHNAFITAVAERSFLRVALYVALLLPCWLLWLSPRYWREALAALRAGEAAGLPHALSLFALLGIAFTTFDQERYWSSFEVFLIAAWLVHLGSHPASRALWALSGASLLLMAGNTYFDCVLLPGSVNAAVQPVLRLLAPDLIPYP